MYTNLIIYIVEQNKTLFFFIIEQDLHLHDIISVRIRKNKM